jgi:hypothetical protein
VLLRARLQCSDSLSRRAMWAGVRAFGWMFHRKDKRPEVAEGTPMKIALALCLCLLAGCSNMKLGAMCYIPHGQQGSCQVAPLSPV